MDDVVLVYIDAGFDGGYCGLAPREELTIESSYHVSVMLFV